MKQFFFSLIFLVAASIVGVVVVRPHWIWQGAESLGLNIGGDAVAKESNRAENDERQAEHLQRFLNQYPQTGQRELREAPRFHEVDAHPVPSFHPVQPLSVRNDATEISQPGVIQVSATVPVTMPSTMTENGNLSTDPPDFPPYVVAEPTSVEGMASTHPETPPAPKANLPADFDDSAGFATSGQASTPMPVPTTASPISIEPVVATPKEVTQESPPLLAQNPLPIAATADEPIEDVFLQALNPQSATSMPAVLPTSIAPSASTLPQTNPQSAPVVVVDPFAAQLAASPAIAASTAPSMQTVTPVPSPAAPPITVPGVVPTTITPPLVQPALSAPTVANLGPPMGLQTGPQYPISPPVLIESQPVLGTEMVARVGTEIIMMCDILPQLRRAALRVYNEQVNKTPPEQRHLFPPEEKDKFVEMVVETQYANFLEEQIQVAMVINDFSLSRSREEFEMTLEQIGSQFEKAAVPVMLKEFGLEKMSELRDFLHTELGSSWERERMLWIRNVLAEEWIRNSVAAASSECTYDEMHEYYTANIAQYTTPARAQWQEICVYFAKHATEQEAMNQMIWMGNQVADGASFEEMAKQHSEGFTADKGGFWDWTGPGSLSSPVLEQAIFSQPVGLLSPQILKSDRGFHIIRVVQREEQKAKPFQEVQSDIRRKILQQRSQKNREDYVTMLKRKYPVQIYREKIDLKAFARKE